MKLQELHDNPNATKKRKRVGRGPGSGTGKTAGRGMKGQKSSSGVSFGCYEGGKMPLYLRMPIRGFTQFIYKQYAEVNLGALQRFIDEGKIKADAPITEQVLLDCGLVRRLRDGVRILGKGELKVKVDLVVTGASKGAVVMVEKLGGTLAVAPAKPEKVTRGKALVRKNEAAALLAGGAPKAKPAPKAEEPKAEEPKAEAPKAEATSGEAQKAEAKSEEPKAEDTKAEASKTED